MYWVQLLDPESGETEAMISCLLGETVADAASRAGLQLHVACERGGCGACRAVVVAGQGVYVAPVSQKQRQDRQTGAVRYELLCRYAPTSDLVVQPLRRWRRVATWGRGSPGAHGDTGRPSGA
jgi:ferredoxin